jgi:hypothetical protein
MKGFGTSRWDVSTKAAWLGYDGESDMEEDGGSINNIDGTYTYETYTYDSSSWTLLTKAGINFTNADSSHTNAVTATGSDT